MHAILSRGEGLVLLGLLLGLQLVEDLRGLLLGLRVVLLAQLEHLALQWVVDHVDDIVLVLLDMAAPEQAVDLYQELGAFVHLLLLLPHLLLLLVHLLQPLGDRGLPVLGLLLLQCDLRLGPPPLGGDLHEVVARALCH